LDYLLEKPCGLLLSCVRRLHFVLSHTFIFVLSLSIYAVMFVSYYSFSFSKTLCLFPLLRSHSICHCASLQLKAALEQSSSLAADDAERKAVRATLDRAERELVCVSCFACIFICLYLCRYHSECFNFIKYVPLLEC
jgi:hypothetical protein